LGSGGFQLWSTTAAPPPTDPAPPSSLPVPSNTMVLLLSGTISSATIEGVDGGGDGATFSSSGGVTYTGGLLYTALLANGGMANGGDISFSMVNVIPGFGIDGSTGYLAPFSADSTELADALNLVAVPEPTSLGVLCFGSFALMRRRASRRTR
jgi:hypothetical protein